MSQTFKQPGHVRSWTNSTGSDVTAGKLVVLRSGTSGECGVTLAAIANGATGLVAVSGVHTLAKATGAISAHAVVYRKLSDGNVNTTSTSNTLAGTAVAAATTSATTVDVLLNDRPGADNSD